MTFFFIDLITFFFFYLIKFTANIVPELLVLKLPSIWMTTKHFKNLATDVNNTVWLYIVSNTIKKLPM